MPHKVMFVEKHVSVLDPKEPMLGPVQSGAVITARTAPGCWGPMITPELIGGHEVTQPVAIEGAEVGDAVAIKIRSVKILSPAAVSGVDRPHEGRNKGDAAIAACCPSCGIVNQATRLEGIGKDSVRCAACGAVCTPFEMVCGYTMVFDDERRIGVTVTSDVAKVIGNQAYESIALPRGAKQNPATVLAPSDMVGVVSRTRPFVGNLGTIPSTRMPAVKNCRDSALRMVGAKHAYSMTPETVEMVPMDTWTAIRCVREPCLSCP